jgi:hypothetical protein
MASAGYLAAVSVSSDDITYTLVGKLDSVDYEFGKEEKDTGSFGEAAGSAIAGREQFSGSASGHLKVADAGQAAVLAALAGTCILYVKVLPDGTNGRKASCFVKPAKLSAGAGDTAKFSFSWRQVAVSTAVP